MESKQPQLPPKKKDITIGGNTYTLELKTNGQLIDIERMRVELSGGHMKDMLFGVGSSPQTYVLIDAIACFTVLIPGLAKDLIVKSLVELDPLRTKMILKVYEQEFYPWWDAWQKVLNADDENDKKEEDKKEDEKWRYQSL